MRNLYPKQKQNKKNRKQVRHTHATAAAFEDAIAIMNDIILVLGDSLEYARQRAGSALEVLKVARKNPHAYDADRPSGHRLKIRRK